MNIFVVAGEISGDLLGARIMAALKDRRPDAAFAGVGGPAMTAQGLTSLFPMTDIAVMGIGPVLARLPTLLKRIRMTADAAIEARPDVVVLIDSPDFTHRVAKRIRKRAPDIRICICVSPSVWVWRSGRAAHMRPYTDLLLALLPFEPAVHERLGGPRTVYMGHPLVDRISELRPEAPRAVAPLSEGRVPKIVVLPGSRRSEVGRLMSIFGDTIGLVRERVGPLDLLLPVMPHVRAEVEAALATWPIKPILAEGEAAKYKAFREGDAALAASGTVTLELALSGLPHVIAYRLDGIARMIVRMVKPTRGLKDILPQVSAGLPNIIAGRLAVPEFLDDACTPQALSGALLKLLSQTPERAGQLAAFADVAQTMALPGTLTPADRAAEAILDLAGRLAASPSAGR